MNTPRILSQHGNVIAADFRSRTSLDITVTFKTETLYCDGLVTLIRTSATLGNTPVVTQHFLGDFTTGRIVQL